MATTTAAEAGSLAGEVADMMATNLRDIDETFSDLRDIDTPRYLGPFLRTIRSKSTSGAITGVALGSVNKFRPERGYRVHEDDDEGPQGGRNFCCEEGP